MHSTVENLDVQVNELKTRGYTVIENVLSQAEVTAAGRALDQVFAGETETAQERGWQNRSYTVTYLLPQKNQYFASLCLTPQIIALIKTLLGDDCVISSFNGLSMTPGGEPQQLHRDSLGIAGHILAINVLHTLDEFTRENGCTRIVPFSQDFDAQTLGRVDQPHFQSLEERAEYIEAPAGSVIAYDASIVHAGSRNTTGQPRRALHPLFTRSWIKPQWDIPASLSPEVISSLSPQQKELFGFYQGAKRFDYETGEVIPSSVFERKAADTRKSEGRHPRWLLW